MSKLEGTINMIYSACDNMEESDSYEEYIDWLVLMDLGRLELKNEEERIYESRCKTY